jgi:hypothetical protein
MGGDKLGLPINPNCKHLTKWQIQWIYAGQEFLKHLICTSSGFLALFILWHCTSVKSTEDAIAVVFLILYSVAGITAILPQILLKVEFGK